MQIDEAVHHDQLVMLEKLYNAFTKVDLAAGNQVITAVHLLWLPLLKPLSLDENIGKVSSYPVENKRFPVGNTLFSISVHVENRIKLLKILSKGNVEYAPICGNSIVGTC